MIHSGLYANELQQGMFWASCHMLAYCHKHSSDKLYLVFYLQKCCQGSDAALEALEAGLQSGLVAGGVM